MNTKEKERVRYVKFELWSEKRYAEMTPSSDPSENYDKCTRNTIHLVPVQDADRFGEWMADELGYQDYGNKIYFKKIADLTGEQVIEAFKQLKFEAKKLLNKDTMPEKRCSCGDKAGYVCDCGELLCGEDQCSKNCGGSVNPLDEKGEPV